MVTGIAAYARHPDPRVAAANAIALLVASNQPFYPLYVWWLVSDTIWPTFVTFGSMIFFLAVPAMSRLDGRAGRALLPLTGIANTVLCAKVFGVDSAVEIFLIPCAVLALVLFRPSERPTAFALAGLAAAAYLILPDFYGAPAVVYSPEEYDSFARLNVMSAAALTALVALWFSGLLAEAEESASASEAPRGEEARH